MRKFAPGFRVSVVDVCCLVLATGAAGLARVYIDPWLGLAIAFVAVHFLLFCNVLRIARRLELVWAGVFLALAGGATRFELLSWPLPFGFSATVTLIVAVIGVRSPSYHGIGWQAINPKLPEWWDAHGGGKAKPKDPGYSG